MEGYIEEIDELPMLKVFIPSLIASIPHEPRPFRHAAPTLFAPKLWYKKQTKNVCFFVLHPAFSQWSLSGMVRDIWGMDAQFFFLYCALHTPYMNRDVLRQSFMRERVGAALRASPMGKEVS